MSTLIDNATIKIRRDTAGNWSSNNPTPLQGEWCLETDTGNVKIGDGSTAWNDLGYYIPAKLAIPYDLTSANKTHTLPPITGAPQTESVYWTGGGTYKLTLAVTDGATVGGETAGTWEGEGNGHILVESDGSNWQVREYEDSGSNSNGKWEKKLNGSLYQWGTDTSSLAIGVNAKTLKSITLAKSMNDNTYSYTCIGRPDAFNDFYGAIYHNTTSSNTSTTVFQVLYRNGGNAQNIIEHIWTATGTWK